MRPTVLGQAAGVVVVLGFLLVAFTPVPNVLAARLIVAPRIDAAEAIVVLGGGIENASTLSPTSLQRTMHGIRLYRRGLAPIVIFSGGLAGQAAAEADVMASVAVELGLPKDVIWVETRSSDTWTEALEVARLARPRGVRKILLVTHPFHMLRARTAFERAGFHVLAAGWESGVEGVTKPEQRLSLMREVVQESFAALYYGFRRWAPRSQRD